MNTKDLTDMFGYSNDTEKRSYVIENNILFKLKYSFKYIKDKIPTNSITADGENLKMNEGKNYNWYKFEHKNVTMIVREYGNHKTIYCMVKSKDDERKSSYFDKLHILIMNDENIPTEMADEVHENYNGSMMLLLKPMMDLLSENKTSVFEHRLKDVKPSYTKIEMVYSSEETVYSLDMLMFACDEIFHIHMCLFSENDVLEKLKTLKVGDKFGGYREIVSIKTDIKDEYYHAVGLTTKRTDEFGMLHEKKDEWMDVYSITRWRLECMFPPEEKKTDDDHGTFVVQL